MGKFFLHLNTKIYFGQGEISKISALVKRYNNPLIVIGHSPKKTGLLDKVIDLIRPKVSNVFVFEGIEPNPSSKTINKAGQYAKDNNLDLIIALGGGSVMDAAKGIAIVAISGVDIWDYVIGNAKLDHKVLPIITIPTLAATGSETNYNAVISNYETKEKYAIHYPETLPFATIIDPELTLTAPMKYVIDGGIDIIVHLLETYLSNPDEIDSADYLTLGFSRTVKRALEVLKKEPNNIKAREQLSWVAPLAINGMLRIRPGGWPIHAIEHAISAIYNISHGAGLSFLLPVILEFDAEFNKTKILRFIGFFLYGNEFYYSNDADINHAIGELVDWMKYIGAGASSHLAVEDFDPDKIASKLFERKNPSLYNPKPISYEMVVEFVKKMKKIWG